MMRTVFAVGMVRWVHGATLEEGIVKEWTGFGIDGACGVVTVSALDEVSTCERQVPRYGGSAQ